MTQRSSAGERLAEEPIGEAEIRAQLVALAATLEARLPLLVGDMRDLLATRIEPLRGDPQLVEMLYSSVEGNLATILHVLANDTDVDSLQPTTAAVEYAARLAQRGVGLGALTRAYYLGQSMLIGIVFDEVERLGLPEGHRIEVARQAADVVHRYIDWIMQYVANVHETERRRWWSARATINAAIILKVLRGDEVAERSFARDTGYDLGLRHLALVATLDIVDDDPEQQQRTEQLVRRIAALLSSAHAPLMTAADRATAWAWIATPLQHIAPDVRAAVEEAVDAAPGVRVALGEILPGRDGFRRSHEQALTARLVALGAPLLRGRPVVSFTDPGLALMSIMMKDEEATVEWMHEVLGPFAAPGEAHRAVRETLTVYYSAGENFTRTAEIMGVHRNTARHRVARFEADRPDSRPADPLEVALALRVFEFLSERRRPE